MLGSANKELWIAQYRQELFDRDQRDYHKINGAFCGGNCKPLSRF